MSAAEIINVMQTINQHVTKEYCDAIYGYLAEQTNTHLSFERHFFNDMDQSVQRLINDMTSSLKPIPQHILTQIQKHCRKYNQHKKTVYDNHLGKIREFDNKIIGIIEKTLKEKVLHQNNLIDTALENVTQLNAAQDLINLLAAAQNIPNVEVEQPVNGQNGQSLKNVQNVLNIQNIQNAIYSMNNSRTSPITPAQTATKNVQMANNMNQLDQINQFLSIISQAQNSDNITERDGVVADVGNNDQLNRNIVNKINTNALSHDQSLNHSNTNSNNNMNNNSNSMTNLVFPPLSAISPDRQNFVANNKQSPLQLKNLIAPIHYGHNKAPLPIQSRKISALTIPTTLQQPANARNNISAPMPFPNSVPNILPSFPFNSTTTLNNNANALRKDNLTSYNSGNQSAEMNMLPGSNISTSTSTSSQKATIALSPTAPPKPPPPTTFGYNDSSSDASSICLGDNESDSDSDHRYECTFCNKDFDTAQQWRSHLKKSHFKTDKKKKAKNSKHRKKSKRKRKRVFSKMNKESDDMYNSDDEYVDVVNISNKRRRKKFECEYCDKQYCRFFAYVKHYNNHMITNGNNKCNFCRCQFKKQMDLKKHINAFGGGMIMKDGRYQCCQCVLTFANRDDLQSHLNCAHVRKNKKNGKGLKMFQLLSLRGIKHNA